MKADILEICDSTEKSAICDRILHSLPEWFGVERSILEYVEKVGAMPFYAATADGDTVGFVALLEHNRYTAEICVMGILQKYHRMGIGRALVRQCIDKNRADDREFLTVKTLDSSAASEEYARTRLFYESMGFRPLEVFPTVWDEANPCLFLAMHLPCISSGDLL